MKQNIFFTVIVAVFNAERTLQQCINSFTSQTFINKELIIIDGASSDASIDIIKQNDHAISYAISEPDSGIYNAWNKALPHANGNWIYFLGADDFFSNQEVLAEVAKQLSAIPLELNVAYGQVDYISPIGSHLFTRGEPWERVGGKYKQLMTIPHQGVFHHRKLFDDYGGFNEEFRIAGDYEFLLRELKSNDAFFMAITVAKMRQGGISNDISQAMIIIDEMRLAQKYNGLHRPGLFWVLAKFRVYIRICLWKLLGENVTRKLLDLGRCLMNEPKRWDAKYWKDKHK